MLFWKTVDRETGGKERVANRDAVVNNWVTNPKSTFCTTTLKNRPHGIASDLPWDFAKYWKMCYSNVWSLKFSQGPTCLHPPYQRKKVLFTVPSTFLDGNGHPKVQQEQGYQVSKTDTKTFHSFVFYTHEGLNS